MMRLFLHPGDEFMLSTPTFELFRPRAELCNAKVEHNKKWMAIFTEGLNKLGLKPYPANGDYMLIDGTMTGKKANIGPTSARF